MWHSALSFYFLVELEYEYTAKIKTSDTFYADMSMKLKKDV